MVFKDMVKERYFISTCAFVPILLYALCQCIYVLKFEIKYVLTKTNYAFPSYNTNLFTSTFNVAAKYLPPDFYFI